MIPRWLRWTDDWRTPPGPLLDHVRGAEGQRGARQTRAVPSWLAEAMRLPSGKNVTEITGALWPSYLCNSLPVAASQTRTVGSPQPLETRRLPSGETARQVALGASIRF